MATKLNPCALWKRGDNGLVAVTGLEVDYSFEFGNEQFLKDQELDSTRVILEGGM